jgi:hypothetical protein
MRLLRRRRRPGRDGASGTGVAGSSTAASVTPGNLGRDDLAGRGPPPDLFPVS